MLPKLNFFIKFKLKVYKKNDNALSIKIGQGLWTKFWRYFQTFSCDNYHIQLGDDFPSKKPSKMVRVLNVAEKNDAAKNLSEILSNGHLNRRNGLSIFNKIYEFDYQLDQDKCAMVMTSVSGHLLNIEFSGQFKNWKSCNPIALFEAPINNVCPDDYENIKKTLELEAKLCSKLIIWTDGDREGENIGFEIIGVCKNVLRARFSEITRPAITRAIQNLQAPDKRTSDAVEVRKELDLRIGAAFTRFQTLRLKKVFPAVLGDGPVISYGSCQFPTMGFVIERYKEAQNFIPQEFWKIEVKHKRNDIDTNFSWNRNRVFDKNLAVALCIPCWENRDATVKNVQSKSKSKWRPLPLDTVELEKNGSRKLKINAKETMKVAESLYTRGFISYPRTETNMFPKEMDLAGLVQMQTVDANWGDFAQRVLQVGPNPRQGMKTDNAHPPIHPTKYTNTLGGNEKKIYDFIVRHFLACISKDAVGFETTIEIGIATELFTVKGLIILEKNYLEVYPYEKWTDKELPEYRMGEIFTPDSIEIEEGCTTAPQLLTEADLIALMEKHGIGTDATHADHIEKIKERLYVGLNAENRFVPGELGIGLADGYDSMGVFMSKPNYRSELEADLKRICEGTRNPNDVLKEQIKKYKDIFVQAVAQATKIDSELSKYFGNGTDLQEEVLEPAVQSIMKCPRCKVSDVYLKEKRNGKGFYLTCMGYPACDATIWLPDTVEVAVVSEEICQECRNGPVRKIKFLHRMYNVTEEHTACFGGCSMRWFDELGIRPFQIGGTVTNNVVGPLRELEMPDMIAPRRVTRTNNRGNTAPRNNRRMNDFSNRGNDSAFGADVVCCTCGLPCKALTVRKESANKGRKFFACSKPQNEQCGFFKWADQV